MLTEPSAWALNVSCSTHTPVYSPKRTNNLRVPDWEEERGTDGTKPEARMPELQTTLTAIAAKPTLSILSHSTGGFRAWVWSQARLQHPMSLFPRNVAL